jgi:lysozyme
MMSHDQIVNMLIRHEGTGPLRNGRLMPYQDTVGKWTIGYGRNLSDMGVTENEALYLLENDVGRVREELDHSLPWWREAPDHVQLVLLNMGFNLGVPTLLTFTTTLELLRTHRYALAAHNLTNTKWHGQVGARALELEALLSGISETT